MEITAPATLLTAESRPYSFEGNEGVSHRVRINIKGEIFACKSTEQQVKELKDQEGKEGRATLRFTSRKEKLALELVEFES